MLTKHLSILILCETSFNSEKLCDIALLQMTEALI